jgi:riboflavin synthase
MFTGIIEIIGVVKSVARSGVGVRLCVNMGELAKEVKLGGSVAINGACQSAVAIDGEIIAFDTVYETLSRTNLGDLKAGDKVNIELAMRATDRLDGHFVQGHVDGTCRIARWEDQGASKKLSLEVLDRELLKYIIPKGSVSLDGISLTIAEVTGNGFAVALIPMTLKDTTLVGKPVGGILNLEADILVKTIVATQNRVSDSDQGLKDALRNSGFTS